MQNEGSAIRTDNDLRPAVAFHPGTYLLEELEARNITQSDFAEIIDRPLKTVNAIIKGKKSITPETARAFSDAFGTSPDYWLGLQSEYDLWVIEQKSNKRNDVGNRSELYHMFPVRELKNRKYIQATDTVEYLKKQLCDLYGVNSLAEYREKKDELALCRKSNYGEISTAYLKAWIELGRILSRNVGCPVFDPNKLETFAVSVKKYSIELKNLPELISELNATGVRILFLPHFTKTKVDGAVFWDSGMPVILMSLRYDRVDNFFFTLLHEIGHILLHKDVMFYDDMSDIESSKDVREVEANEFAENHLVTKDEARRVVTVQEAGKRLGVNPGIVVGTLHHHHALDYRKGRHLLEKVVLHLPKELIMK